MLVSKYEDIRKSIPYLGYLVLKKLQKDNELSIYDIFDLYKKNGVTNYRQIIFPLIFLNSLGLIEFDEPNIRKIEKNEN